MGIFQTIPTDQGGDTIRAAQKEILNRANANHLSTEGWSLAELCLDDNDVEWLHSWARTLDDDTANRWISPGHTAAFWGNPQTRRVGIGILLMLLAAEQVRRTPAVENPGDQSGERDWIAAFSTAFNEETRKVLFKEGAPAPALIGSFKEAAHRLRLRLSGEWDTPTAQRNNMALQIALTEADLPTRLAIWLNGDYVPEHLQVLLDPVNGSDSFLHLWLSCQDFLKGVLNESELRQTLSASVWVLPRWIDSIVETLRPNPLQNAEPAAEPVRPVSVQNFLPGESEDIFGTFMPYGGVKTIIRAACAIIDHADKLGIRTQGWSPTELHITDYDYAWMRVWVRRLEPETVSHIAENERDFSIGETNVSLRAALGTLLALWIAETAHRGENGDDELWAFIASEGFKAEVAAELFRQAQPSSFLRVLLSNATRELNLREGIAAVAQASDRTAERAS